MTPLKLLRVSSNASVLHTYGSNRIVDSENEVEIDNLELQPTQDSELEIIENSDLDLVQVSEAEDLVDRLLQSVFQPAASSTQNRDPGLESLEWSQFPLGTTTQAFLESLITHEEG